MSRVNHLYKKVKPVKLKQLRNFVRNKKTYSPTVTNIFIVRKLLILFIVIKICVVRKLLHMWLVFN